MPSGKPGTRKPKPPDLRESPAKGKPLDGSKNPGGRPTMFSAQVLEETERYFEEFEAWYESPVTITRKDGSSEDRMERIANPPPSILDLHRFLKSKGLTVSRWSLYDWCDEGEGTEIKEFSQIVKKSMARLYPEVLQENAIMGKYPGAFPIFAAKNRMKWTDKQEIEHSGEIKSTVVTVELPRKK
jgi:hypothetical protein